MRLVYRFLSYLVALLLLARMGWRGLSDPAFRAHWLERLGWVTGSDLPANPIWVHAVSVGEVRTAHLLIEALSRANPEQSFFLTVTTVTGRREAVRLWGSRLAIAYFPFDLTGALQRFVSTIKPAQVVIIETEIWPMLYDHLSRHRIPLTIVNAKISARSVRRWRAFKSLLPARVVSHPWVFAQSEDDRERFLALGFDARKVVTAGHMKLAALHVHSHSALPGWSTTRAVWIAGSTRDGEEEICLAAHRLILEKIPNALLIVAPRHPERFETVANLIKSQFYDCARRSRGDGLSSAKVALLDTIGELPAAFELALVGLVGGTLAPFGGHNPLELVAQRKAMVLGPYDDSIRELIEPLVNGHWVDRVVDAASLSEAVFQYLKDPEFARVRGELIYREMAQLPTPLPILLQHLNQAHP